MRIDVYKHWPVSLDFGRAGILSLQLYRTYHRLLHMRVAIKYHALPVFKKNRIASLLCIFESTIMCVTLSMHFNDIGNVLTSFCNTKWQVHEILPF